MTGNPVPMAKTTGKYNPSAEDRVMGMSIPKNRAPLYGQNASAKIRPIKNDPKSPLSLNASVNLS